MTPAAGRHTKTRYRRADHHESSWYRIVFWSFYEALPFWLIRHWSLKCGCVVLPSWGTTPRNSQGRGSAACVLSQTVGETW